MYSVDLTFFNFSFIAFSPAWSQSLFEQWIQEYPDETRDLAERFTITPRREDVDKLIIRKAVNESKKGRLVKIVSNTNFGDYIGEVEDFHFSEDWVREHVPDSDEKMLCDVLFLLWLWCMCE